jgi:hypothetical protein
MQSALEVITNNEAKILLLTTDLQNTEKRFERSKDEAEEIKIELNSEIRKSENVRKQSILAQSA